MFGKLVGESETQKFDYSEPGVGGKIISEYGVDIMSACISGLVGGGQIQKLNEFCSHMAAAALQGDSTGIALSCFSKHEEPFNQHLPIPIHSMPEEAFANFVEIIRRRIDFGFSKSVKQYLQNSKNDVKEKADEKNPYALWLMGAWYAFDDSEKNGRDTCMQERMFWYEEAAYEGYTPAMQAVAVLYDEMNPSFPTNLKKSAFWYRHGALFGDAFCAYNLGVMYAQGDFVEQNLDVAKMWLSVAYKNSTDSSIGSQALEFAKRNGIHLSNDPDTTKDPELNSFTSEFQDAYN